MAAFRIKRLPLIGGGVAEVDWGPVFHVDQDFTEDLTEFLTNVHDVYHREKGLEVRFTPRGTLSVEKIKQLADVMEKCGFRFNPNVRAYRTSILDVSRDLATIRKQLAQKWRNRLNAAERAGLMLETNSSPPMFDRFYKIYQEMWSEKRFRTGVRLPVIRKIHYALPEFLGASTLRLLAKAARTLVLRFARFAEIRCSISWGPRAQNCVGVAVRATCCNGLILSPPRKKNCAGTILAVLQTINLTELQTSNWA